MAVEGTSHQVPVHKFTYLPLKPRLARLFGTTSTAAVLQSHTAIGSSNRKIFDIQQSMAWENAYGDGGIFGGDPRGRPCVPTESIRLHIARSPTQCDVDLAEFA